MAADDRFVAYVIAAIERQKTETAKGAMSLPPDEASQLKRLHLAGIHAGLTLAREIIDGWIDQENESERHGDTFRG